MYNTFFLPYLEINKQYNVTSAKGSIFTVSTLKKKHVSHIIIYLTAHVETRWEDNHRIVK